MKTVASLVSLALLAVALPPAAHAGDPPPSPGEPGERRMVVVTDDGDGGPREARKRVRVMRIQGRPMLGLMIGGGDDADPKEGAPILAVTPGGPAAEAGLKAGDLIVAVNGKPLRDLVPSHSAPRGEDDDDAPGPRRALVEFSRALKPGEKVTVDYRRDGRPAKATLTAREVKGGRTRVVTRVGPDGKSSTRVFTEGEGGPESDRDVVVEMPEIPEIPEMPRMPGMAWHAFPGGLDGLELTALNPDLGDYFGTGKGLLVTKAPAQSELKAGDVILKIGEREPKSPAQAMRILRSYEAGESARVEILRRRAAKTLSVKIPAGADDDEDDAVPTPPSPPAPPKTPK